MVVLPDTTKKGKGVGTVIDRYTRPKMGQIWSQESRFKFLLDVEIAVAEAQAELGIIPKVAAKAIKNKSQFSIARILEIEAETRHDIIAFVSNVAENVGTHGRYVHFGMTSSDVLDTALSLQIGAAGEELLKALNTLEKTLSQLALKEQETLCAGRTHGMFAEPTSFGLKMAGFLAETKRNKKRVIKALEQIKICKLSGAVGTYSSQPPQVEKLVAKKLGLVTETVATQVVPRDRHAEVVMTLALLGAGFERLSVELRHLQRSEVSEVIEGFKQGQKGSSAMPHKKNPISAENITGIARLLRGYAFSTIENVALWHERDISHSSVERVVFPDAFIVAEYAAHRLNELLEGLTVCREQMLKNVELSKGQLFSSHVLLALVDKGFSREAAYKIVQRLSHSLGEKDHLKEAIKNDFEIKKILSAKELDDIFSGKRHLFHTKNIIKNALKVQ
jgi:adenylosuccinate lyase